MSDKDTFESLILEAKEAGRNWKRRHEPALGRGIVSCENDNCVLGAVMLKRGVARRANIYGTNKHLMPHDLLAAKALEIPFELAKKITAANDGKNQEDAALLDKLLGIKTPLTFDSTERKF